VAAILHTPLSDILVMPVVDAIEWHHEAARIAHEMTGGSQ